MSEESPDFPDASDDDDGLSVAHETEPDPGSIKDKRIAFAGKLGGASRREATEEVRKAGGAVSRDLANVDWVVIGADELPLGEHEDLLPDEVRDAAAHNKLEIISETEFWSRLGYVDGRQGVRELYTPAMLADLLGVSVASIRRWRRRGLITPVREVKRLPYFDFQEVASARRLAKLISSGASPEVIEKKLAGLARFLPEVERPLAQLSIIVEGRQVLLRQGEGLVEPQGQMRLDFDAAEQPPEEELAATAFPPAATQPVTPTELIQAASTYEEAGDLETAIELLRAALAAGGPRAELCFQLAEWLYLQGDLSAARERYFVAIELEEDYVEARANLGCVLAELGSHELAVSAFEGALALHPDYPDVHYHLASTLDDLNRQREADPFWARFLELAPTSPWAEEARQRLSQEWS